MLHRRSSSAELSEAINSIFMWYENSEVCLAHLEDDESGGVNNKVTFEKSVWFTRCWTSQELLVPELVEFFDSRWRSMGSKDHRCEHITELTGIPSHCLCVDNPIKTLNHDRVLNIRETSIAEKMSWASNQQATRSEDIAYSLMGLFNINMPLLYREGDNAFVRLQEEIIASTDDISFLLWESRNSERDLFAKSPANYSRAMVEWLGHSLLGFPLRKVFGLNNLGLEIETHFLKCAPDVYGIVLARHDSETAMAALLIRKSFHDEGCYHRIGVNDNIEALQFLWNEKRKGTLLRDTGRTCCQLSDNMDMVSSILSAGTVDHVEVLNSATTIKLNKPSSTFYEVEGFKSTFYQSGGIVRLDDEALSRLTCNFSSRALEILRTSWHVDGGPVLWLDICFDFDSYPCVLLQQQINGKIPDKGAIQTLPQEHRIDNWSLSNSHMLRIRNFGDGRSSFFYRFRPPENEAVRIPAELSGPRRQLVLEMSRVSTSSIPFSFWRLEVVAAPLSPFIE